MEEAIVNEVVARPHFKPAPAMTKIRLSFAPWTLDTST
jgi:hypothetical protein